MEDSTRSLEPENEGTMAAKPYETLKKQKSNEFKRCVSPAQLSRFSASINLGSPRVTKMDKFKLRSTLPNLIIPRQNGKFKCKRFWTIFI